MVNSEYYSRSMYSPYNQRGGAAPVAYPATYNNVRGNAPAPPANGGYDQGVYAANGTYSAGYSGATAYTGAAQAVYNYSPSTQEIYNTPQVGAYNSPAQGTYSSAPQEAYNTAAVTGLQTTYSTPYQRPAPFPSFQSRGKIR